MAKIKLKSASLSSDPEVKVPRFYFMPYSKGMTVTNNEEEIDFVTDGKSLYVAFQNGRVQLNGDEIGANSQYLLKIVSQGEKGEKGNPGIDGAAGVVPEIGAEYIDIGDEKKLALTVGGKRKAMTGDLTPPVYVPTLVNDRYLTWEWNGDEPATIDLMKLRPVNERPILLRTNSDNTKLDAEVSGPANFIQWKYEGDEHWTNLISIQELMNLAFAGMCTWEAADGKWHFGYKEVVKATYDSTKSGRRIINRVELGQILFDAGEIPLQDYGIEIEMVEAQLEELKNSVQSISIDGGRKLTPDKDGNVDLDLSDYAKKSDVPTDYVKSVKVNGESHSPVNGVVDLGNIESETVDAYTKSESDTRYQPKGNYLTQHQSLKTINSQSLVGTGNIIISGDGQPVDLSGVVKSLTIDEQNKTPDSNGNISFTLGNFNLFNLEARTINDERHLVKIVNGTETDLGVFGTGSGEGCDKCWSEEEILELIAEEIAKIPATDLSGFYRKAEVDVLIQNLQNQINALIDDDPTIVAISFISTTIYTRTNDTTAPSVQTSFAGEHIALDESGDVSETALAEKLENVDSIWTTSPGNGNNYLWVSYARVKIPDGVFTSDWSTPLRLTGVPGRDGSDGGDIEFVYFRNNGEQPGVSNTGRYYDADTQTYSADTTDASHDDFLPKVVLAGDTVNDYWKDHPEGISPANTHEWVAIRTKKRGGSWGNFSVALWSRWGEDGVDGDGVQYIYTWSNEFPHTFTGVEDPTSWDTTSASYQSKYDEYMEGNWVDDPRGVSAEHPFEWVSIRKWRRVNGVYGWQSYSTPALWSTYAESATTRTIVTLDINNSQEPVQITAENKVVKGTDPIFLDTQMFSVLRTDQGELLDWGKIFIGKYTQNGIVFDEDPFVTFDVNRQATITNQNSYDGNIIRTIKSARGDEHRYYEFVIGVSFPENYVLSEPYVVPIKVVDDSELFTGIDYLKFNPIYSEKLVTLNYFEQTNVIKKESKESTTYSPSSVSILGSVYGDSTFDTVSKFTYSYQFDDNTEIIFDQPTINKQAVLQAKSANYYFNIQGNEISSSQDVFAELHIWNSDDNQVEWDEWIATMKIKLDGNLIEDKVTLGVGYNRVISDRENSYIIYPGKNGINGQKGDKGDVVQDAYFLTAVYDEGSGNWATWFDNIRNSVSGYSWVPGELGQRWTVNHDGTSILTETPVTLEQPTMTSALKYLWKTSRAVTYNGNTPSYGEWSVPVLTSQTGPKGEDGKTVVTHQYLDGKVVRMSNWTDNQLEYSNGETAVDGIYYLDVVKYVSGSTTSYYKCISDVTYTSSNKPSDPSTDSNHWEAFIPQSDAWFETMLANSAYIENLTSHQVVITDSDNTVVGGMTSSTGSTDTVENRTIGNVRIWAGETTANGNLVDAPFTVTNQGIVTSQGSVTYQDSNDVNHTVGVKTTMNNGSVSISTNTGSNNSYVPRAEFGFNESGELVLKFYDALGNELYNLGPGGLKWAAAVDNPSWDTIKCNIRSGSPAAYTDGEVLYSATYTVDGTNSSITGDMNAIMDYCNNPSGTIYRFNDGKISIGPHDGSDSDLIYYINPLKTGPDLLDTHSSINGKLFDNVYNLKDSSVNLSTKQLPAGEYVIITVPDNNYYPTPEMHNYYNYKLLRYVYDVTVIRSDGTNLTTSNTKIYREEDYRNDSSTPSTIYFKLVWGNDPGIA